MCIQFFESNSFISLSHSSTLKGQYLQPPEFNNLAAVKRLMCHDSSQMGADIAMLTVNFCCFPEGTAWVTNSTSLICGVSIFCAWNAWLKLMWVMDAWCHRPLKLRTDGGQSRIRELGFIDFYRAMQKSPITWLVLTSTSSGSTSDATGGGKGSASALNPIPSPGDWLTGGGDAAVTLTIVTNRLGSRVPVGPPYHWVKI